LGKGEKGRTRISPESQLVGKSIDSGLRWPIFAFGNGTAAFFNMIKVARAYDAVGKRRGRLFLVDRLWPRGVKKEALTLEAWPKAVSPSDALRKWFKHDPAKWKEFQRRYFAELDKKPEAWQPLLRAAQADDITLVFGARDREHNNAVALKSYLEGGSYAGVRR
jgi:uncharacterized protein YeaO (DUF488 family)